MIKTLVYNIRLIYIGGDYWSDTRVGQFRLTHHQCRHQHGEERPAESRHSHSENLADRRRQR